MKVTSVELLYWKWMYVSNRQNNDFNDLLFDGDQSLITRQWIYCVNDGIVESLNSGLIIEVYENIM